MITSSIIKFVAPVLVIAASFAAGYQFSDLRCDNARLERDAAMYRSVNALVSELSSRDAQLITDQNAAVKLRRGKQEEALKTYEKNIDSHASCIDDSGLLDVINASMPTTETE